MIRIINSFGKKGVEFDERFFSLKDIIIKIGPPEYVGEIDIPDYERIDMEHYRSSQFYYFELYKQNLEIERGSPLSDEEMNSLIINKLEKEFRYCYYHQFRNDRTKIK